MGRDNLARDRSCVGSVTCLNGSITPPHTWPVRRALLIIVLLSAVRASATSCVTVSWTAREFLTSTTTAARVVAVSPDTLRVTSTLFGTSVRDGDVIRVVPGACNQVVPGVEYFVATRCGAKSPCEWNWTEVERSSGFEHYARNRHVVTRAEVMEKLRLWQKRKLSTEGLRLWLSTADTRDSTDSTGSRGESLALAVIERIEDLLEFAVQAEACNPADAAWLREQGSAIFLERFARLPRHETLTAYEAWLDEHEDAEDEWDPERLESDLELSLERARSWDHTIDCFLRSHREASK